MGRLLLTALLFGLLAGGAVSWLVARCWAPVLDEAVGSLPPAGAITGGKLHWPENSGRLLGANRYLSIEVTLDQLRAESPAVDFSLEFQTDQLVMRSLLGRAALPYPPALDFELNRTALAPAWGAWKAPLLAALIPGTAVLLMLAWFILAIPYTLIPRFLGALLNRDLTFRSAWKLSVAAQLAGALLLSFALALYGAGQVALLFVLVMLAAHFIPTLLHLLLSPFFLPRLPKPAKNPFQPARQRSASKKNPFRGARDED